LINDLFVGMMVDGKLRLDKDAQVSCRDYGILYGYGLFETIRVYPGGRIFSLEKHLERLFSSCSHLGIDPGLTLEAIASAAREYVAKTGLHEGALRLTVTKGDAGWGIRSSVFFFSRQVTYSPLNYEQGFAVTISPVRKNQTSPLVYHKTLNYMENLLALEAARRAGAQEAIFLNTNLKLTEGAVSNLFFVRDKNLYTPDITCGLLAGITRQTVIDLATARGYQVIAGEYVLEDLLAADEAFLTNSLMEVMPLCQVNETPINRSKPGPTTRELLQYYRKLTEKHF